MPFSRPAGHPIMLGIVGDSATGKTTLAAGVAKILGPERVATICTDDYHKYSRAQREASGASALDPDSNYLDILAQHLALLRRGQPILKPVYNHATGELDPPVYVEPRPYIVVEGMLGYLTREMRDCFDAKVYMEPDEDLRMRWKLQRDTVERGYTREQVLAQLTQRQADRARFIHPQRTFADIVICYYPPQERSEETGAHLNVRHVLRPTLPHPDLTPILEPHLETGLRLQLARDADGKPVDVVEIPGAIDDRRAKSLENLLWELIPEASHLRANVGEFTDQSAHPAMSHPLALTQLLLAYHMVKAAMGVRAV